MSATIPFHKETFKPLCIPGNAESENPVEFEISSVGGASRARLKSMIVATSGLVGTQEWTPDVQENVIAAFGTGAAVFTEGVGAIRNLRIPVELAARVGVISELPKGMNPELEIGIEAGRDFARVCGYWPILAFEVAMAIARVSANADIDPRFFSWLSVSAGMPGTSPGSADAAATPPADSATAASSTRKGGRRRST